MNTLFNYHRPSHQPCSCQLRLQWEKCFGCAPASSVFPHHCSTMNFCSTEHLDSDASRGPFTPHCFTPSTCTEKKRSLSSQTAATAGVKPCSCYLCPQPHTAVELQGGQECVSHLKWQSDLKKVATRILDRDLTRTVKSVLPFLLFIIFLVRPLCFAFIISWKRV